MSDTRWIRFRSQLPVWYFKKSYPYCRFPYQNKGLDSVKTSLTQQRFLDKQTETFDKKMLIFLIICKFFPTGYGSGSGFASALTLTAGSGFESVLA